MADEHPLRAIQSTIIEPCGFSSSECGYCHSASSSSSHHFGVWAHNLSPEVYQSLLNQGWRRSGLYLYLPHIPTTCCPAYPIRCSAKTFKPTKSQRQTLNRWKSFLLGPNQPKPTPSTSNQAFDVVDLFALAESNPGGPDSHNFKIKIEPASFSEEKYALYERYQIQIHKDPPTKLSARGFRRFLCDNPFPTPSDFSSSSLPPPPGSYHASYILDNQLIAFSVFDVLPEGLSSVYFVWEPSLAHLSLGKISALRELAWIRAWMKPSRPFEYYFLGLYIHSCPKMRYKGEYQPSEILNPANAHWYPLSNCLPRPDHPDQVVFEPSQSLEQRSLYNECARNHFERGHSAEEISIEGLVKLCQDLLSEDLFRKVLWVTH